MPIEQRVCSLCMGPAAAAEQYTQLSQGRGGMGIAWQPSS